MPPTTRARVEPTPRPIDETWRDRALFAERQLDVIECELRRRYRERHGRNGSWRLRVDLPRVMDRLDVHIARRTRARGR